MKSIITSELENFEVETASLKDNDLRKALLSPNAKKFAIAREINFANGLTLLLFIFKIYFISNSIMPPVFAAICISVMGSFANFLLRSKIGVWPAFIFSIVLTLVIIHGSLRKFYAYQVLSLDRETADM